ncbi:MAG: hypothetical protein ABII88_10565 [Candidatus Omnitrophota bacterium]
MKIKKQINHIIIFLLAQTFLFGQCVWAGQTDTLAPQLKVYTPVLHKDFLQQMSISVVPMLAEHLDKLDIKEQYIDGKEDTLTLIRQAHDGLIRAGYPISSRIVKTYTPEYLHIDGCSAFSTGRIQMVCFRVNGNFDQKSIAIPRPHDEAYCFSLISGGKVVGHGVLAYDYHHPDTVFFRYAIHGSHFIVDGYDFTNQGFGTDSLTLLAAIIKTGKLFPANMRKMEYLASNDDLLKWGNFSPIYNRMKKFLLKSGFVDASEERIAPFFDITKQNIGFKLGNNDEGSVAGQRVYLSASVAGCIGKPAKYIHDALLKVPPELIAEAYYRRFNLLSNPYGKEFQGLWGRDETKAIEFLARGYKTLHDLNSQGHVRVDFIPHDMKGDVPEGLEGMVLFSNSKKAYQTEFVEWAWVPEVEAWLPVADESAKTSQRPAFIRVVLTADKKKVVRVAKSLTKDKLQELILEHGDCIVCGRVPPSAHLSLVRDSSLGIRESGNYTIDGKGNNLYIASLSREGVPTGFQFFGNGEKVPLRVAVKRNREGKVMERIESQRYFAGETLAQIYAKKGQYWVMPVYVQTPVHSARHTKIQAGSRFVVTGEKGKKIKSEVTEEVEYNYYLDAAYSGAEAQLLIGRSGVPVYLYVSGDVRKGVPALECLLKLIEVRNSRDEVIDVINSSNAEISRQILQIAVKNARVKDGRVVVTRIPVESSFLKRSTLAVRCGGEEICVNQKLPDFPGQKYAELVYGKNKFDAPVPISIRIGFYEGDDPLNFNKIKFHVLKEFFIERAQNNKFYETRETKTLVETEKMPLENLTILEQAI